MTAKSFNTVFSKISLSERIRDVLDDTEVRSLVIHKKEKKLEMALAAKYILPKKELALEIWGWR